MRSAKDIEAEAALWIARLDNEPRGSWPAEFHQWFADHASHRVAFTRLSVAWKRTERLRQLKPLDQAVDEDLLASPRSAELGLWTHATVFGVMQGTAVEPLHQKRHRERARWSSLRAVATAAALAVIVVLVSAVVFRDPGSRVYETAVGGHEHVPLQDGSVAELNTNTRIRVRYTAARREVQLLRGEALFTVAHDATRPFEVVAAGVKAQAVGTEFAVRLCEDGRVETTVKEGHVIVLQPERFLGVAWRYHEIQPALHAWDRALVDDRSVSVTHADAAETSRRLMWTLGRASFRGQNGAEIAQELNRYSLHRITVTDRRVATTRFGGSIDTTHPESFGDALTQMFGAGTFVISE